MGIHITKEQLVPMFADARAREQAAIDALPMLVSAGTISQTEADGVRALCEKAIAQIDAQAAKL